VIAQLYLLFALGMPLLLANLAEEVSALYMYKVSTSRTYKYCARGILTTWLCQFWSSLASCTGLEAGTDDEKCASVFQAAGLGAVSTDCPRECVYDDGTNYLAAAHDMYSGSQMTIVRRASTFERVLHVYTARNSSLRIE